MLVKAHCNECEGEKNHELLHQAKKEWQEEVDHDYGGEDGWIKYQMLQCCGCESVTFRHQRYYSGDRCSHTDDDGITETYYPPAISRKEPEWLSQVSFDPEYGHFVKEALTDIYTAIHNGSFWLACMGTRSLLEHVMIEMVGDHGSFTKNINAFFDAGHITPKHKDYLVTVVDAGHASTHRGWKPNTKQLNIMMDVAESIIQSLYVLQHKIEGNGDKQTNKAN
jgi:hypothetical protein